MDSNRWAFLASTKLWRLSLIRLRQLILLVASQSVILQKKRVTITIAERKPGRRPTNEQRSGTHKSHAYLQPMTGVTPSERYLAQLARQTFLSIWSYTNLFTDEGRKKSTGDGKELCDLLVVFDNYILLFSDKHCAFPEIENVEVAWRRWYKRAIDKSAKQLFGAENWIRRFPDRIFLDRHCTKRFPLPIPDLTKVKFFRLAVTRGSYSTIKTHWGRESTGSFIINTALEDADHLGSCQAF